MQHKPFRVALRLHRCIPARHLASFRWPLRTLWPNLSAETQRR